MKSQEINLKLLACNIFPLQPHSPINYTSYLCQCNHTLQDTVMRDRAFPKLLSVMPLTQTNNSFLKVLVHFLGTCSLSTSTFYVLPSHQMYFMELVIHEETP